MCCRVADNSVISMTSTIPSPDPGTPPTDSVTPARSVSWLLAGILGVVALIRPVVRIVASESGYELSPVFPILLTLGITVVWIIAVVTSRTGSPVLTLVAAGLVYGVLSIALSGILSPILDGELQGPLANPVAIVPVLLVNALWGLVAGLLALFATKLRPSV